MEGKEEAGGDKAGVSVWEIVSLTVAFVEMGKLEGVWLNEVSVRDGNVHIFSHWLCELGQIIHLSDL